MDNWEVAARTSIRDLVARYNASGDSGRLDQVMELFAPDAVMEIEGPDGPEVHHGQDIRAIFTAAASRWSGQSAALLPSGEARLYVRHRVATHQVDFETRTSARGYCYFDVLMPHGLDHWGRYFDRYEERDGRWLFIYRKVTTDGRTLSSPPSGG